MIDRIQYIKELNDKIFNNEIAKNKKTIIFVYTPPKVGSTSLVSSLRISGARLYNVVHIHDEKMLGVLTNYDNKENVTINEVINYNSFIGKNVYVIDVYRNPIERKISEYFEMLTTFHFNVNEYIIQKHSLDTIIKRFNSIFPFIGVGDYFFDKYDIDLPKEFDFENKYLMVNKNNISYIKLRLCDSNEWAKILSKLLKLDIVIVKDYQTENKIIGDLYKKFKDNYSIPYNLLELVNGCKYFNYYNSINDKKIYNNIWNEKKSNLFFKPFSIKKYNFYKEISNENQINNNIHRDHYLDYGCICKSCCYKRCNIFNKIKKGEYVDIKIIHEQAVYEKKIRTIKNICSKIISKSSATSSLKKKTLNKCFGIDIPN
jgi:small nuclear ribonucleoprotein (snRNP)-like protein